MVPPGRDANRRLGHLGPPKSYSRPSKSENDLHVAQWKQVPKFHCGPPPKNVSVEPCTQVFKPVTFYIHYTYESVLSAQIDSPKYITDIL